MSIPATQNIGTPLQIAILYEQVESQIFLLSMVPVLMQSPEKKRVPQHFKQLLFVDIVVLP
jgi:hypothetical protein